MQNDSGSVGPHIVELGGLHCLPRYVLSRLEDLEQFADAEDVRRAVSNK